MFGLGIIQKVKIIRRLNKVLFVLFKHGFSFFIYKAGLNKYLPFFYRIKGSKEAIPQELPRNLRKSIEKLGPTFVKFGQILSTRWDLLPREYIEELEKLQANVPPFPFNKAKKIIEKSFKKPLESVYKNFDQLPFASASLGQVHLATLKTGEKAAVKIQRPKAKERIKIDTQVLLTLAHFLEKRIPSVRGYNLIGIVKEFRRWTLNELDYRKEAANCEIFNNFFKDDPYVFGPQVFWEYSNDRVLTLEFIDGICLQDVLAKKKTKWKVNRKLIAKRGADSFIKQYFEYGFFHADPHPGNIFILKNNVLMFLDLGMVGWLDDKLKTFAAGLFLALLQKDIEKLVTLLLKIEEDYDEKLDKKPLKEIVKVNALRKELNELVQQWTSKAGAGSFTKLFYELLNTAVRNGIGVPIDLIMLSKSIVTIDAVAKELDPEFRLEEWEGPLVEKIVLNKLKPKKIKSQLENTAYIFENIIKKFPESTEKILKNIETGKFGLDINTTQLLGYETLLDKTSRIKTQGTLIAGILIASALLYQVEDQPIIFGWPLAKIGLYTGLILAILLLVKNIFKKGEDNYE